jgi:hypothetical protein
MRPYPGYRAAGGDRIHYAGHTSGVKYHELAGHSRATPVLDSDPAHLGERATDPGTRWASRPADTYSQHPDTVD